MQPGIEGSVNHFEAVSASPHLLEAVGTLEDVTTKEKLASLFESAEGSAKLQQLDQILNRSGEDFSTLANMMDDEDVQAAFEQFMIAPPEEAADACTAVVRALSV